MRFGRNDGKRVVFYGQVESYDDRKEYLRGGRCIRLVAVESLPHPEELTEAVTAYVVDIDLWEWYRSRSVHWHSLEPAWPEEHGRWVKVEVETDGGRSYFYPAFASADIQPTRCVFISMTVLPQSPVLPTYPSAALRNGGFPILDGSPFELSAFHVGQGMAAVISNGSYGLLMDAGAGKPVTRSSYRYLARNDLVRKLSNLKSVEMVLSHADADHWRIIQWDPSIRSKIKALYAPDGVSSILFNDPAIKSKVYWISDQILSLGMGWELELWRTRPAYSDANGEALVGVFVGPHGFALLPGDYVYHRCVSDGNPKISALANRSFAAVVVPHHGDAASARHVFAADVAAKAFFSAGMHEKWRHPRKASLDAHAALGYKNISDPRQRSIIEVPLI